MKLMFCINHIEFQEDQYFVAKRLIIAMKDYTLEYKLDFYNNCTRSSSFSLHIYPDSKYFAYKHPTSNYKEKF